MRCKACGDVIDRFRFWAGADGPVTVPVCSSMCAAITDADRAAEGSRRLKWREIGSRARFVASFALSLALGAIGLGCGGSALSAQLDGVDRALTATTTVADPLYGTAVAACDGTEAVIVARPSSYEGDKRDIAQVRAACDLAFAAFEALRRAQAGARLLVHKARSTGAKADADAAFAALEALGAAAETARATWEAAARVVQGAQARQ